MPKERLYMRKIREVLRLKYELGRSNREISRSRDIGSSTVSDYLKRARMTGLTWPLSDDQSDGFLERALFPPPPLFIRFSHERLLFWQEVGVML